MDDRGSESGEEDPISPAMEAPMDTNMETQMVQPTSKIGPAATCAHSRLIDDILTKSGKRTGKARCLECGSTLDDPCQDVD